MPDAGPGLGTAHLRHHHSAGASRPGGPRLQSLCRGGAGTQCTDEAEVPAAGEKRWGKSWKNHGKIMEKSWKHHGKIMGKWWENDGNVESTMINWLRVVSTGPVWVTRTGRTGEICELKSSGYEPLPKKHIPIEVTRRIWHWWIRFQPLGTKGFDQGTTRWSWSWYGGWKKSYTSR